MPWTTEGAPVIGAGCMRLSTDRDRDEDRAIAVLHAAFDAGVNFLDTANVYCWDDTGTGHNERLIARALAAWNGDRSRIWWPPKAASPGRINWVADGRARHLIAACGAAGAPSASSASACTSFTRPTRERRWRPASAP